MPFIELQSVDSTNNYAFSRIHAGLAQDREVIFAHEQYAGKGQRGKTWTAEKGANLIMSIIMKNPPFRPDEQFQLSACVAVAVHDFFSHYAGDETKIKWPNDLYWQDRKAGGILIESVIGTSASAKKEELSDSKNENKISNWRWAVIGTGININQTVFDAGLKKPVSLKQITGKTFSSIELAKELAHIFNLHFTDLCTNGFAETYAAYNEFLFKKEEIVKFKKDSRVFEALVKKVLPSGQLLVQHSVEEIFNFGEVEWVING